MDIITCPICNKRVCDSNKHPKIAKLSKSNELKADLVIKCNNCKSFLSIRIPRNTVVNKIDEPPMRG